MGSAALQLIAAIILLLALPARAQDSQNNPCLPIPDRAKPPPGSAAETKGVNNFYLMGAQICDPTGQPFIAVGTNLTGGWGLDSWVSAHTNKVSGAPDIAPYYQGMGFNAVRLVILDPPQAGLPNGGCESHALGCIDYAALHSGRTCAWNDWDCHIEDVVQEWTDLGMVVMVDNHSGENGDQSGTSQTEIDHAREKMVEIAKRWAWPNGTDPNPYVWLEINNEPLEEGSDSNCKPDDPFTFDDCELTVDLEEYHREITSQIRTCPVTPAACDGAAQTNCHACAENIVVWQGSHYGQDRSTNITSAYSDRESYIIWSGSTTKDSPYRPVARNPAPPRVNNESPDNVDTFANLVYDVHFYSRWGAANQAGYNGYINHLKDATTSGSTPGIAIVVGETGGDPDGGNLGRIDWPAAVGLYTTKPPGIGIFCWWCVFDALTAPNNIYDIKIMVEGNHPSNLIHYQWLRNLPSRRVEDITPIPYSTSQECLP